MGWRGTHSRNWVYLDFGYDRECRVVHEVKHETQRGLFAVVDGDYDEFYVIWRPNRNVLREYSGLEAMQQTAGDERWRYRETVIYKTFEEARDSISARWMHEFNVPKKRKRSPRDSQKSKVYAWEHKYAREHGPREDGAEIDNLHKLHNHDTLRSMLEHVCLNLGEETPELKFRTGGRSSYGGFTIRLLPCHCNLLVLLHELAHVLHRRWHLARHDQQAHGPEYMGIFAYLLIRFGEADHDILLTHAADSKVKVDLPQKYWDWRRAILDQAA